MYSKHCHFTECNLISTQFKITDNHNAWNALLNMHAKKIKVMVDIFLILTITVLDSLNRYMPSMKMCAP